MVRFIDSRNGDKSNVYGVEDVDELATYMEDMTLSEAAAECDVNGET